MLPGYIGPALDFFDAFLTGRSDPAGGCPARPLAPRGRGLAGVALLAASGCRTSCASTSPAPSARRATQTGGSLVAEPGERGEATWVHDPDDLVPSTLVNPFAALLEYPDERDVESRPDVMTFTTPAADEPMTLAGRVVARLEVGSDAPSLFLHVKLVDVHEDGRAHALLFGQQVVEQSGRGDRRRGLPRPHGLPHRARPPAATARRNERLPGLPPPPRYGRESVGRDGDA